MDTGKIIDRNVVKKLAEKYKLSLVVLFGSQVSGKTHPESDTDIAFISREPMQVMDTIRMQMEFSEELKINDLDLVDLRGKPPLFLKQVALNGIALYETSRAVFTQFRIYAVKLYIEYRPLFLMRRASLEKFLHKHL